MLDTTPETLGFLTVTGPIWHGTLSGVTSLCVEQFVKLFGHWRGRKQFEGGEKQAVDDKVELLSADPKYLGEEFLPLLGRTGDLRFHFGGEHYLVQGVHADNSSTGQAIARAMNSIIPVDFNADASIFQLGTNNDWLLIGGPSSCAVSRRLLGYNQEKPRRENNEFGLRYAFQYDDKLFNAKRYRADGSLQAQAKQTFIRDRDQPKSRFEGSKGDWIDEDYLLITRLVEQLPNGNFAYRTVIGGNHGIGTRGVGLVLSENKFTKRQMQILKGSPSKHLQILARVEVEHDHEHHASIPTDFDIREVVSIAP